MTVRKSSRLKKSSESGNILVALAIAIAVTTGYMAFYFTQHFAVQKLDKSRLLISQAMRAYLTSVQSHFISQSSLISTLQSPSNGVLWRCVNDPEFDCTQLTATPLKLLSENGDESTPFVSENPANGLTAELAPCSSFPSVRCPFRYQLNWHAECVSGSPCNSPDIFVEGSLMVSPNIEGAVALNPINYRLLIQVR